jgi:hypothetical protein
MFGLWLISEKIMKFVPNCVPFSFLTSNISQDHSILIQIERKLPFHRCKYQFQRHIWCCCQHVHEWAWIYDGALKVAIQIVKLTIC